MINLYNGRLLNSGIELDVNCQPDASVRCLENEIRQVLNNLIANAIDAMREGGRLSIRARNVTGRAVGPSCLWITVADTGHGMPQDVLTRIYEAFFTTKELNGTPAWVSGFPPKLWSVTKAGSWFAAARTLKATERFSACFFPMTRTRCP